MSRANLRRAEDETQLSGVMLDAMPPASRARHWRKVFGRQRKKGRDAPHIAPDTALGREVSPGPVGAGHACH